MLKAVNEVSQMINEGKVLHIAGNESLLAALPKGNWIGGTNEYFMCEEGNQATSQKLYASIINFDEIKISVYDETNIHKVANDAFENGFSIVIMPYGSPVLSTYGKNAPSYENMFMRSIAGWVAGVEWGRTDIQPKAINGLDKTLHTDHAVVMHVGLPAEKTAIIDIINIFEPNNNSPIIKFMDAEAKTQIHKCLIDGKETILSEYLKEINQGVSVPFVGSFGGAWLNATIFSIDYDEQIVTFATPVFPGINYRFAIELTDYPASFARAVEQRGNVTDVVFCCACYYNYLFGELEGKKSKGFNGPAAFGEIAYQLLNQTLVYITVK